MGLGDISQCLELNDLHMFALFIRTGGIRGLGKAEVCSVHEPLFPPLTCSCSLPQLSSGICVNVPTIKHEKINTAPSLCLLCVCTQLWKTSDA